MSSELKIPTFLGLAVLILGLGLGVYLTNNRQTFTTRAASSQTPKNVTVANITSTSASIYWQTDELVTGFVTAGTSGLNLNLNFSDERDPVSLENHSLHFVTLARLSPDTTYQLKIHSGSTTYPNPGTLEIKTAALLPPGEIKPLTGYVLDESFQPVSEALVVLEIPGVQKLASITKVAGSFVISLTNTYSTDLSKQVDLTQVSLASKLRVFDNNTKSDVALILPVSESLPPIILGTDRELSATPLPSQIPTPPPPPSFDLTKDGYVNSLDASLMIEAVNKKSKDLKYDLNQDKVVDQKDLDLISRYTTSNQPVRN